MTTGTPWHRVADVPFVQNYLHWSSRRPELSTRPVNVGSVVVKVALGQVYLRIPPFRTSQCHSTNIPLTFSHLSLSLYNLSNWQRRWTTHVGLSCHFTTHIIAAPLSLCQNTVLSTSCLIFSLCSRTASSWFDFSILILNVDFSNNFYLLYILLISYELHSCHLLYKNVSHQFFFSELIKWYTFEKRGDYQKKLWNVAHQKEENEEDLKLPGRNGLEDCWGKRD